MILAKAAPIHRRAPAPLATILLLLALPLLFGSACASSVRERGSREPEASTARIGDERTTLRVGIAPDAAPFAFRRGGRVVGIEAELAGRVAAALVRELRLVELERSALHEALASGEVDVVMSAVAIDEERSERIRFTRPIRWVALGLLCRAEEATTLGSPESYERPGIRIGFVQGARGARYVGDFLTRSRSYGFDTLDAAVRSLRARRIDLVVHDRAGLAAHLGDGAGAGLTLLDAELDREPIAWALSPGDERLARELDRLIVLWESSGELDAVFRRWTEEADGTH